MSLVVTGLVRAMRFTRKMVKGTELEKMHEEIVIDTVSLMRRYAAVDTGEMLNAIRYEKLGNGKFKIIVDVPYAIYQEYGTQNMPAGTVESPKAVVSTSGKPAFRPFIRPAIWLINKEFPEYIKRVFMSFRK